MVTMATISSIVIVLVVSTSGQLSALEVISEGVLQSSTGCGAVGATLIQTAQAIAKKNGATTETTQDTLDGGVEGKEDGGGAVDLGSALPKGDEKKTVEEAESEEENEGEEDEEQDADGQQELETVKKTFSSLDDVKAWVKTLTAKPVNATMTDGEGKIVDLVTSHSKLDAFAFPVIVEVTLRQQKVDEEAEQNAEENVLSLVEEEEEEDARDTPDPQKCAGSRRRWCQVLRGAKCVSTCYGSECENYGYDRVYCEKGSPGSANKFWSCSDCNIFGYNCDWAKFNFYVYKKANGRRGAINHLTLSEHVEFHCPDFQAS